MAKKVNALKEKDLVRSVLREQDRLKLHIGRFTSLHKEVWASCWNNSRPLPPGRFRQGEGRIDLIAKFPSNHIKIIEVKKSPSINTCLLALTQLRYYAYLIDAFSDEALTIGAVMVADKFPAFFRSFVEEDCPQLKLVEWSL
jgi:CRISPR/Cas system-associated exonuclease Cas4 (RecB family)